MSMPIFSPKLLLHFEDHNQRVSLYPKRSSTQIPANSNYSNLQGGSNYRCDNWPFTLPIVEPRI